MPDQPQPTDWPAAWAALSGKDDGEWDAESTRLETLWKAEYVAAFVVEAVSRNWTSDDAKTWAAQIVDDALNYGDAADPSIVALADVIECEWETANAV